MQETADIETSSDGYAARFAGPAGEWMLALQTRYILALLSDQPGARILDVGGGHAQAAIPLMEAGHKVTVLGSDLICVNRLQPHVEEGRIKFVTGSVIDLPFNDDSFDVVLSLRLVAHCESWETLLKEMCRVSSKTVLIDYPALESFNRISGLFFERKKKIEKNTRTWLTYNNKTIRDAFTANGFGDVDVRKQFFWPMAIHRMLKSPFLSKCLEFPAALFGLRCLWGSPVILRARSSAE